MKATKVLLASTLSMALLSGCASNGGGNSGAQNFANGLKDGVGAVASGIGDVIGNFGQPYTNGVKVTE